MPEKKRRVLIAKAGLDGHERGARIIARSLSDAGMEVVYLGFTPQGVSPEAVASVAIQEDVDVIGISIHVPIYIEFLSDLTELLREKTADIPVILGGIFLEEDIPKLEEMGVKKVFGQNSSLDSISECVANL